MLRFLADENFNKNILNRLRVAVSDFDAICVQDTEVYQAPDPVVLEWAAQRNRIVLTHDINTMPGFAFDRVRNGQPMPGVIEVALYRPVSEIVEDLLIMIGTSTPEEFDSQVRFIPIR